jgi:hypothetical protein
MKKCITILLFATSFFLFIAPRPQVNAVFARTPSHRGLATSAHGKTDQADLGARIKRIENGLLSAAIIKGPGRTIHENRRADEAL